MRTTMEWPGCLPLRSSRAIRTLWSTFLLISVCMVPTGCVSGIICTVGKRYENLAKPGVSVKTVRKQLGEPEWSCRYGTPKPIEETEEFKVYRERALLDPYIKWPDRASMARTAATCEVYTRRGPFYNEGRMVGSVMAVGCTFGVAEVLDPLILPFAIKYRFGYMAEHQYSLTFWYDNGGYLVGHFYGDIRSCEENEW